ncbi:MAG: hypothetical protein ND807_14300 [Vicinamibacterales bacterium]|nr:hypothetical protein [Vicinamibacterales bacterium]
MKRKDESGIALIVTLMVMMLLAALMAGFFAAVNADTRSNALDKDQTRAYAAAHAGLEKLTSDLAALFNGDVSPSTAQINALAATPPSIPGFEFRAPGGVAGSGYSVTWKADVNGNPAPDDVTGSNITAGPYRGLKGIITKYPITITARSTSGGAEVRLRRDIQTVAVPVFQFGLFSETDLSFFAGPDFNFGGRVHTNGTLFLAEGDGNTLTLGDRVTAASEVIRWQLSNGYSTASDYTGTVSVVTAQGGPFRNLARSEGSLVNGPSSAVNEPTWTSVSVGAYKSYIRSSRTGAKRLDLPIVSQQATPIDLIRRPSTANEDVANTAVYVQRFYAQASLRILLSDRTTDITNLPTVTGTAPVALSTLAAGVPAGYVPVTPIAKSPGIMAATTLNAAPTSSSGIWTFPVAAVPAELRIPALNINTATPMVGVVCTGITPNTFTGCTTTQSVASGRTISATLTVGTYSTNITATTTGSTVTAGANKTLTVNANQTLPFSRKFFWLNQNAVGATTPAGMSLAYCTGYTTTSFTGCTFTGDTPANNWTISTNATNPLDTAANGGFIKIEKQSAAGAWSDVTTEILNLGFADRNQAGAICGADPTPNAVIRFQRLRDNGGTCDADPQNPYDYWPNALYDAREGSYRDNIATGGSGSAMYLGGLMHFVSLDVANLKRWLAGGIGTTGTAALNNNGYIVYFSDRRGDHDETSADAETGRYGAEDVINPASAAGTPSTQLEAGEDVDGDGVLDTYGETPSVVAGVVPAGATAPMDATARPSTRLEGTAKNPGIAFVNRQILFRRALKLINGGINGGVNNLPTAGLTVAAENPVYVQGNYNATGASANANPNVPAAVIADAVTLLSNQWADVWSFVSPSDPGGRQVTASAGYRMAVAAGKTLSFTKPTWNGAANDFGTDGGVHNFLRYLEDWNGQTLNYRGSIVSLYTSRQAIGTYKCCTIVYSPPTRAYNFDTNFLTPSLLPPGTPMFRDVNTLTFRQILRPTQ